MENFNQQELCILDYIKDKLATDVKGTLNLTEVSEDLGLSGEDLSAALDSLAGHQAIVVEQYDEKSASIVLNI